MKRRINYTGRKRIDHSSVSIKLTTTDAGMQFDANLSLEGQQLPDSAAVYVEAYKKLDWMRFEFGTIGSIRPPSDRALEKFANTDGLKFRVKVVATDEESLGKLLAEADRIKPTHTDKTQQNRRSILPIDPVDLDGRLYRLNMAGDPVLEVDRRMGENWLAVTSSPLFQSLVFPAVFHEILWHLACGEEGFPDEDEPDGWRSDWGRLVRALPGFRPPETTQDDIWVEDMTDALCRSFGVLDRFNQAWLQGGHS